MTPQNLTCHKKPHNSGIDTLVDDQPVVLITGRGAVQMGRLFVAYLVAALVPWALAEPWADRSGASRQVLSLRFLNRK